MLRNKSAREASVRIPLWVDRGAVRVCVGEESRANEWFGQYLQLRNLASKDTVTVEFPMAELTEKWTSPGQWWGWWPGHPAGTEFTFRFKGNTLVEIPPHPTQESPTPDGSVWWPYSRRAEKYAADKAPVKHVTQFVTPIKPVW